MSPEQARGKAVDKRADVWAFGCVLYEMLTGQAAFAGDNVTDVLAGIIEREPDFTLLPPTTPPAIRRLLRRSLEKDRKRRLSDIADARIEIDEALTTPIKRSERCNSSERSTCRMATWVTLGLRLRSGRDCSYRARAVGAVADGAAARAVAPDRRPGRGRLVGDSPGHSM